MKFGTSGLRGLSKDLVGPDSALFVEAFLQHLKDSGLSRAGNNVYIAADRRASSPDIANRCRSAIVRQGMTAVDCGKIPTPALALYAQTRGAPALMVTGSHIPEDRNGIKFYRPDGEIDKKDEQAISGIADAMRGVYEAPSPSDGPMANEFDAARLSYLNRCMKILTGGALSGFTVGLYEHSTVARDLLAEIFENYGAKIVRLGRSQQFLAVDTESISPGTSDLLRQWCRDHELDAIISADGDGDRPLLADGNGEVLRGDLLGLLSAEFLRADTIVTPVTSNSGIRSSVDRKVVRTKVGSPYVIAAMRDAATKGVTIGFEANGGVLLGNDVDLQGGTIDALPTRDCVLPLLAAFETSRRLGKPFSAFNELFAFPIAVSDRVQDVPRHKSQALMRDLEEDPAHFFSTIGTVKKLDMTDGPRFTLDNSEIIHFRPSGNAPELRCYCEAGSKERATQLLTRSIQAAKDYFNGRA